MSALQTQQADDATYVLGTVTCRRCGSPIRIHQPNAVAAEFSARCLDCGERGFFSKRQISLETMPERRKKERFGRR